MSLNKTLYRQAYQQYQETENRQKLPRCQPLSPIEAWRQSMDLVEFCQLLCPNPGQHHRDEKFATLQTYYERIRQLEAWRLQHGKTA